MGESGWLKGRRKIPLTLGAMLGAAAVIFAVVSLTSSQGGTALVGYQFGSGSWAGYARSAPLTVSAALQNASGSSVRIRSATAIASGCPVEVVRLFATRQVNAVYSPPLVDPGATEVALRGLTLRPHERGAAWYVVADFTIPEFCASTFDGFDVRYFIGGVGYSQTIVATEGFTPDYLEPASRADAS
jgi:hypothetical protein